jgi:transmembrane sensor
VKSSPERQRQDTATHWYVRLQNPQLPASERIDFRRWLDSDPANAEAFHDVELLWRKLDAPAHRLAGNGWYHRPSLSHLRGPALAACLLGLAIGGLLWWGAP